MEKILFDIIYILVTGVGITLATYIVKLINTKIDESQTLTELKNYEQLNKYIDSAQKAISDAVLTVNQTYVDSLKKTGEFSQEAQDEAKMMAIEIAKQMITEDCVDAIETVYDDFDVYLDAAIESMVRNNKKA